MLWHHVYLATSSTAHTLKTMLRWFKHIHFTPRPFTGTIYCDHPLRPSTRAKGIKKTLTVGISIGSRLSDFLPATTPSQWYATSRYFTLLYTLLRSCTFLHVPSRSSIRLYDTWNITVFTAHSGVLLLPWLHSPQLALPTTAPHIFRAPYSCV